MCLLKQIHADLKMLQLRTELLFAKTYEKEPMLAQYALTIILAVDFASKPAEYLEATTMETILAKFIESVGQDIHQAAWVPIYLERVARSIFSKQWLLKMLSEQVEEGSDQSLKESYYQEQFMFAAHANDSLTSLTGIHSTDVDNLFHPDESVYKIQNIMRYEYGLTVEAPHLADLNNLLTGQGVTVTRGLRPYKYV